MSKKNMLGMDMTEWKHLSGLADPYTLALAEAGAQAGVPKVIKEDDDDAAGVPRDFEKAQSAQGKKVRLDQIKRAARNLAGKTRNAAQKSAATPAKDRYKAHLELAKHRKTFVKAEDIEGYDPDIMWAVYLESIGSSAEEFENLLNVAIENDDEDMAIDLIAVEDQLDELLGAIGAGLAKGAQVVGQGAMAAGKMVGQGAMAAGKGLVKGAQAVGSTVAKGAQAAGSAVASGAKAGFNAMKGAAPAAPPAGGSAPAGATPPAGGGAAPAGATPPATAAAPAGAATPAAAPTTGSPAGQAGAGKEKKLGLLGTLGRGIGKVAKGVAGIAAAPLAAGAQVAKGAAAGYKEDVDAWEEFIAESFDMTAEEYVEAYEHAVSIGDEEMIESANQLDEIFAAWRAKKAQAAQDKQQKVAAGFKAARDVVAKHGADKVKAASLRGKAVDAKPAAPVGSGTSVYAKKAEGIEDDPALQIMESSGALAPRPRASDLKALISSQLQYSGYSDEYIEGRSKAQQYHGMMAQHPDKGIRKIAASSAGKEQAAGLVSKTKDKKNQLAPQLVKAFRADNKAGKAERK